ncbi:MAG: alpha/beta fold hydrolase [Verrucomicrobia bacterium]|nr:alpha/beta fold hydrolase [Verrucomicrobiota bacterium]
MPVVASRFCPPFFLCNGHVQTVLSALWPRGVDVEFQRERLELMDGDFVDLGWRPLSASQARQRSTAADRLVILSHGLEGSSDAGYIRGMAAKLNSAGWDVLVWDFRGCSQEMNRLPRFYHSGETGDLGAVIDFAATSHSRIALVGFSLGGNLILKYLGEANPHPAIVGAAAISAPVELGATARALDRHWARWIYRDSFIKSLIAKVEAKAVRFPDEIDVSGIRKIRTFEEFDDRYTAPIHGFRDAEDYWEKSSARQYLHRINVPTLILNACDDPLLTPESFPVAEAEGNRSLFLEMPKWGGHLGFVDLVRGIEPWSERRVVEFLTANGRE